MIITGSIIFFVLKVSHLQAQISAVLPDSFFCISSSNFGYNGRSTEGPSWFDSDFLDVVQDMNPGVVRYPAGTQANYWNWRRGTFIEGCGKSSDYIYSIPMLTAGLPDSTEIIYVMNLARPLPWTEIPLDAPHEVLASDSVLHYKITDVLEALNEFEVNGKLPMALELGNEFYFDSEHGTIYAANPSLYLSHSAKIIKAVKEKYPGIKILLITTKGGTVNRDFWNNTVIQYLEENGNLGDLVDGLVQHHYINDSFGDPNIVFDTESSLTAITEALQYTEVMDVDYSIIPDNFGIWFTEMGITKGNADETWVAGLRAFLFSMEMALLGERVETVLYHHITEKSVLNKDFRKLGSSGIALSLIAEAVECQSEMNSLAFEGSLNMIGDYASLYGYVYQSDSTLNLILMNISDQNISDIDLSNILSNNVFKSGRQYYSNKPWVPGVFEGNGIQEQELYNADNLILEPFSLTIIKTQKQSSVVFSMTHFSESAWKVYPNPHSNYFFLEGKEENPDGNYRILDIKGQLVKAGLLHIGANKIYYTGNEGIYILILNTSKQHRVYRLIKSGYKAES